MITSITNGPRQSNIELLRIVAMFLVMIVHADFWSLGAPNLEDYTLNPVSSISRSVIQCCAIICVNVFICISGWFGIKSTLKGLCTFIFQSIFLVSITYVAVIIFNHEPITLSGIRECLLLRPFLWFVIAYIGLYILAPVLNKFTERASNKEFLSVLIPFFIFQTVFGISGAAPFVMNGYSVFSFVGLYLLTQYIRKYGLKYRRQIQMWGGIALFINILGYIIPRLFGYIPPEFFLTYISPLVIWTSVGILLYFEGLKIKPNKFINWISKSVFAVYLIHQSPFIAKPIFKPNIQELYATFDGLSCLMAIFAYLVAIFIASILIDKIRIIVWANISKHIHWPKV